jgi:hypothetical protein
MRFFVIIFFILSFSKLNAQIVLNDSIKQILLSEQNYYRKIVGAKPLVWSKTLANKALEVAEKMAEKPYSYLDSRGYGMNIYRTCTIPDAYKAVDFWMWEQIYYTGQTVTQKNIENFQHYMQLICKKTYQIGCAEAKTKGGTYILVCLYNPKFDITGLKP